MDSFLLRPPTASQPRCLETFFFFFLVLRHYRNTFDPFDSFLSLNSGRRWRSHVSRQCSITVLVVWAFFLLTSMVWVAMLNPSKFADVPRRFYFTTSALVNHSFDLCPSCAASEAISQTVHSPAYMYGRTKPQKSYCEKIQHSPRRK